VLRVEGLRLVCDAQHLHSSTPEFADQFHVFASRLGAGAETNDIDEWEESAGY
jgi:hypothetical protein